MTDLRVQIQPETHFNPIIEGCLRQGKPHMIAELLNQYFHDKKVPETTLSVIIKGSAKQNKVDMAFMYQNQLLASAHPDARSLCIMSLNSVIEACFRNERIREAKEIFDRHLTLYQHQTQSEGRLNLI